MASYDLVFVHAPSVHDFRKKSLLFGPVSDMIPSTPVFEMYPIGFTTIASMLHKRGYRVRILNLAAHMLANESFDVEKAISKINSRVFGIDLHWLPHAHGSLEIAKIIKRIHPDSKVIMGGFSATYFWEELMRDHGYVDALFIGDSTELPMLKFFRTLDKDMSFERVPNMVYRDGSRIRNNGITHIIKSLDEVEIDYRWVIGSVMRTLDLTGHLPYMDWVNNPMFMVNTVRGCMLDCLTCMGGCCSFKRNFGRTRPAFRSPKKLMEDIDQIESYFKGTIFVIGDIRQPGNAHAARFLSLLRKERLGNEIGFEFFTPPGMKFVKALSRSVGNFNAQISPDSHDPRVREAIGRYYSNEQLERSVKALLDAGAGRMDIFYMIGLPYQDRDSVLSTVKYSEALMKRLGAKERLMPFISPLGPFLDPGGEAFENPEKHGYTILAKTLAQHRELLTKPSWKMVLNYSTKWLSPDQMVDATYDAGLGMNEAKRRIGAISEENAGSVKQRITLAKDAMKRIDDIVRMEDPEPALSAFREELRTLSESTVCNKRELDWNRRSIKWSIPRIVFSTLIRR